MSGMDGQLGRAVFGNAVLLMQSTVLAVGLAVVMLIAGLPVRASAATCTVTYTEDGFPVWSAGCSTTVAPGRFGPLRMGQTTVADAKSMNYLAYNQLCGRWDGVLAYPDWRKKRGKLVWWRGGTRTSKGLLPTASLKKARSLYPNLSRTGFIANEYVPGQGWKVYSVKTRRGWLDWYRINVGDRGNNFFAVRALTLSEPQPFTQDGC